MLEWTGERYLPYAKPELVGAEIHYEHLHRYAYALQFATDKVVLDLACGEGYGSSMLSMIARQVVGVDIDIESIKHASRRYAKENLTFLNGSIAKIPIEGSGIFDLIVCFEALEHITEHDLLFSEVKRLLKEDGIFIVSTPNKMVYSDQESYENPFHHKELYFDEFRDILNKYFENTYLFGQRVYAGSDIWRLAREGPSYKEFVILNDGNEFSFKDDRIKVPRYFIALASNKVLDGFDNNSALFDISHSIFLEVGKVKQLEEKVQGLQSAKKSYEKSMRQLAESNAELQRRISILDTEIRGIENSIVWSFVMFFHNNIVARIFPEGTGRNAKYHRGLEGLRQLKNGASGSIGSKFKSVSRPKPKKAIGESSECIKKLLSSEVDIINKDVSIVIPTRNAGPEFEFTLERLKRQLGISRIEIIVADSMSTDNTRELATAYGCKILEIDPKAFNHGLTRNFAAEKATGNYIVFMVQDAIPIGECWLHDTIKEMEEDPQIGAITCRQFPKSDAELFSTFSQWSHQNAMAFTANRVSSPEQLCAGSTPLEKRRLYGLESVCLSTRKDLFSQLLFLDRSFAEDLEYGRRVLEKGYKIKFLHSVGVIHSHNRDCAYSLKRSYVDNKMLPGILSYDPVPVISKAHSPQEVMGSIMMQYYALNASIALLLDQPFELDMSCMLSRAKILLKESTGKSHSHLQAFQNGDAHLDGILDEICRIMPPRGFQWDPIFSKHHLDHIDHFNNFLITNGIVDEDYDELVDCLYKLFSITSGTALANIHYLNKEATVDLDLLLSGGI